MEQSAKGQGRRGGGIQGYGVRPLNINWLNAHDGILNHMDIEDKEKSGNVDDHEKKDMPNSQRCTLKVHLDNLTISLTRALYCGSIVSNPIVL